MGIMGKAERDAAAAMIGAPVQRGDEAAVILSLEGHLRHALDSGAALADDLRTLLRATPIETGRRGRSMANDFVRIRADLAAYDGPGAARVTRGELADAVRLERRYHPKEHERRSDGRCRCNVCTLLDRIAAE